LTYAKSGESYEGEFLNDKPHGWPIMILFHLIAIYFQSYSLGFGIYTFSSGSTYEGRWNEGSIVSDDENEEGMDEVKD
jgi:hypothetical protein